MRLKVISSMELSAIKLGSLRTDNSGLGSVKTDNSVGEIRLNGDIITVIYHVLMIQQRCVFSPLPTKSKGTIGLHSVRPSVRPSVRCPADQFSALFSSCLQTLI